MGKEIATWDKKNITWSAKQITKMISNKTACFDSSYQRTYVWDLERKSLMIHSMIMGIPTDPIWATKGTERRVYEFMDGKQRCNAFSDYINNVFALRGCPLIIYRDSETGEILEEYENINGKYFRDLPEDMRENIESYMFTVNFFEDLGEDEQEEFFSRINHGKVLSPIEISRVKCKVRFQIQKLAHHPVFDFLTEKARERYTDEDIIVKCFAMTMMDIPCLDTRAIRPFMETMEITEQEYSDMQDAFTCIKQMHDEMEQEGNATPAKRLYVKTHMISIIPFVKEHGKQTEFFTKFFGGERMTISSKYNDHATAGVGHAPNVRARLDAIEEEWKRFKNH